MRGSRTFCQRGSNFFLVDEGRETKNHCKQGIISPPAKRHEMAFRWRADDGPTLNAGLVAAIFRGSGPVLLENPIFCDFSGGGGSGPPVPPLDTHMGSFVFDHKILQDSTVCIL